MREILDKLRQRFLKPVLERQERDFDALRVMLGGVLVRSSKMSSIRDAEFSVFSQFGEDGILQFLIRAVPIANESFVEIGVEDYSESNTRFLLINNNWRGHIFDLGREHIEFVGRTGLAWKRDVTPISIRITKDNIDAVLAEAGLGGDVGVFSLDIDGNDYWVLDALSVVSPRIIVVEYNSIFGPRAAVTIPYDPDFDRQRAHHSGLYWGASLAALNHVATRKGYRLIGSNNAGNNAFFVRNDLVGELPTPSVEEAYVESRFRESRDKQGDLTYLDAHGEGRRLIEGLPVWDVFDQSLRSLDEVLGA